MIISRIFNSLWLIFELYFTLAYYLSYILHCICYEVLNVLWFTLIQACERSWRRWRRRKIARWWAGGSAALSTTYTGAPARHRTVTVTSWRPNGWAVWTTSPTVTVITTSYIRSASSTRTATMPSTPRMSRSTGSVQVSKNKCKIYSKVPYTIYCRSTYFGYYNI